MLPKIAPCYRCPDRQIGCHTGCERYGSYRQLAYAAWRSRKTELEVAAFEAECGNRMRLDKYRRNNERQRRDSK